jgi:hypothetical protein
MLPVYEGETHIYLRCPNPECGKMAGYRKQLAIRGKAIKANGTIVETNAYDGEIK